MVQMMLILIKIIKYSIKQSKFCIHFQALEEILVGFVKGWMRNFSPSADRNSYSRTCSLISPFKEMSCMMMIPLDGVAVKLPKQKTVRATLFIFPSLGAAQRQIWKQRWERNSPFCAFKNRLNGFLETYLKDDHLEGFPIEGCWILKAAWSARQRLGGRKGWISVSSSLGGAAIIQSSEGKNQGGSLCHRVYHHHHDDPNFQDGCDHDEKTPKTMMTLSKVQLQALLMMLIDN